MKRCDRSRKVAWTIAAVISLLVPLAFGQQPLATSQPDSKWEIRWSASDEFVGEAPDWKKWIRTGGLPITTGWSWDNARNATVEEGIASLTARHDSDAAEGGAYSSGILKSYRTFRYGYFEARIEGADFPGSGVCPSFWLFSGFDDKVGEGETVYSEIDVVELQQFDWWKGHQDDVHDMDLNLHCVVRESGKRAWRRPKAFSETQLNKWRAPWDPRADFHVYGCEVDEETIVWFVDGKEVARQPNTHWHRPKHVALSLGFRKPFVKFQDNRNRAVDPVEDPEAREKLSDLPATMRVDYVRVWERSED